jgi:SAM-dependent methyltransferase
MNVDDAAKIFNLLFNNIDGFSISMNNRKRLNLDSKELTYGEITFLAFRKILAHVNPKPGEIFYDLGCGTGKVVVAAALLAPWKEVFGIEILEDIFNKAMNVKKQYDDYAKNHSLNLPPINLINTDLKAYDFSNADVIYIASTCFDYDFMEEFGTKCTQLKSGSRVITLTKELHNPDLEKKVSFSVPMTWGDSTVHIYERR